MLEGYIIRYKDGNMMNYEKDNLMCIFCVENVWINYDGKKVVKIYKIVKEGGYFNVVLNGYVWYYKLNKMK